MENSTGRQNEYPIVQNCGPRTSNHNRVWYFYCNRAGKYKPKGSNKRHQKSQGTCKIGEQCSAHLKAVQNINSGCVKVTYCSTHHNHVIKLAHLRICESVRMEVAAKLYQGVKMERILDDIRDSVGDKIKREHLINRQDLHNIQHQYNIESSSRHKNDLTSVTSWVEEMRTMPYNPILKFKQQGCKQLDDMDNIGDQDFFLCIQTKFQKDMCQKFGQDAVCMDSTHGTNSYDFKLVTLLVVDDHGEGIPAGWMVSNGEDCLILIEFLKAIKERTGCMTPKWFMSDDAQQFFTAWTTVFGNNGIKRLLCMAY